jgi:NAD(P)H-hydrate epimerase
MSCSTSVAASPLSQPSISFLTSAQSKHVDERLMQSPGFTLDQLMELAGLSVAQAAFDFGTERQLVSKGSSTKNNGVLIVCGPGNNGGDGLVAARHLKHFGLHPSIVYPKQSRGVLFTNLMQQLNDLGIPILPQMPAAQELQNYSFAIDALFGFSFVGPPREPFLSIIQSLRDSKIPVVSVDVPSGWDVEQGDTHGTGFVPSAVVSLTAPKLCMRGYPGAHYVGGRFVPPAIAQELGITLPEYGYGTAQVCVGDLSARRAVAHRVLTLCFRPVCAAERRIVGPSTEGARRGGLTHQPCCVVREVRVC